MAFLYNYTKIISNYIKSLQYQTSFLEIDLTATTPDTETTGNCNRVIVLRIKCIAFKTKQLKCKFFLKELNLNLPMHNRRLLDFVLCRVKHNTCGDLNTVVAGWQTTLSITVKDGVMKIFNARVTHSIPQTQDASCTRTPIVPVTILAPNTTKIRRLEN